MANVVATVTSPNIGSGFPLVVRTSFTRVAYADENFFTYPVNGGSGFDPTGKGDHFFIFDTCNNTGSRPADYIDNKTWNNTLANSASGFVNAVRSVMPKLFIPSYGRVSNGIRDGGGKHEAVMRSGSTNVYNWDYQGSSGSATGQSIFEITGIGGVQDFQYAVSKEKAEVPYELTGLENGAFTLLVNVKPYERYESSASEDSWGFTMEFGEVVVNVKEGGGLEVKVEGTDQVARANIPNAKGREGLPQQTQLKDGIPYLITCYPVWNGVVVSGGIQDSKSVVDSSSAFALKTIGASILESPYSGGFDTYNPSDVNVSTPNNVNVDFGTSLKLTVDGCRAEFAYAPCYFHSDAVFDEWFLANSDTATTSYNFNVYSIYTDNNTSYSINSSSVQDTGNLGSGTNTEFKKVTWDIDGSGTENRRAGELFGSVLEIEETTTLGLSNGTGSFNLSWSGGGNSGGSGSWEDFIQSINVTVGIDGSSGSIVVDKYGVAGSGATATQSVGACSISMSGGGVNTTGGNIFIGIAMGVGDTSDSSGGGWTINLIGLEQKMHDMALVNCPYMDGYTLSAAAGFLAQYCGIPLNTSRASGGIQLSSSTDLSTPLFDFKSGTSVFDAMTQICENTQHTFVVHSGAIHLYALGADGLPSGGTDRSQGEDDILQMDTVPDFSNIRNDIVVLGLEEITEGSGKNLKDFPLYPKVIAVKNSTNPSFAWSKAIVRGLQGFVTEDKMYEVADRLAFLTSSYDIVGSTTIEGNANIKPYDRWGQYVISSVSHTVDLESKQWTTDLEFSG